MGGGGDYPHLSFQRHKSEIKEPSLAPCNYEGEQDKADIIGYWIMMPLILKHLDR